MTALHPDVQVTRDGEEVRLWAPHVGRGAVLSAEGWALRHERPGILLRLERLGLGADVDRTALIPCPHQATLCLPDEPALWAPVPQQHDAGGHPYRALPLSPRALAVWQALNGRRTVRDVARSVGLDPADFLAVLDPWLAEDVQAVQLRPTPPSPRDPSLRTLWGGAREANRRDAGMHDASGGTTLVDWHVDAIVDGSTHFDDRETTVAHALAVPHPGLAMRPYGTALRQALGHDGPVVEVGCGTGELARDWLAAGSVPYVRVDLSPELLRTQALAAPDSAGVLGDATRLPLARASVPFLLSNEVLADLRSVPVERLSGEDADRVAAYGITPQGFANLGSFAFVAELARVLAPGGVAWLTEFGTVHGEAEEAVQLDHPEVSIAFDLLARVAQHHGLETELLRLDQLLGLDLHAPQLTRVAYRALRALFRARGRHLSARAWTPDNLALPWSVEGLSWTTLADEGPGPLVTRFYALQLRKS